VRFCVRYGDPAELVADHDEQFARGGFLVRVEPPKGLELYAAVELELSADAGAVVLSGQVVQMVAGVGTAIAFAADDGDLAALMAKVRAATPGGAAAVHQLAGEAEQAPAPTRRVSARVAAQSLETHARVKTASKVDKVHLARYGKKDERMHILRGNDRSLHRYVLNNPGLGVDEVVFIAKMNTMSPDMLKAIADRREWAQRPEVAIALVRNPKTPVPLALKLIKFVSPSDLRQLAKTASVRMPILKAVRKIVLG